MTIGELSRQSGVPASTLRYWEQVEVLPKAARVAGQRSYSAEMLPLVVMVRLAKACGFSLPEMRGLVSGMRPNSSVSARWREAARSHRGILEEQIAQLHARSRLLEKVEQCRCADLAECGRVAARLVPKVRNAAKP